MRSEARELLMQLLFQMEVQNDYSKTLKEDFFKTQPKRGSQQAYVDCVFKNFTEHLTDIDQTLSSYSDNWKTNRMNKVDLAIARLSATEILYVDSVPDSVSINEAVDLAKKFGTEDSSKFVNGLLGKVVKEKKCMIKNISLG